jgi:CRP-like cAMP-binding protein
MRRVDHIGAEIFDEERIAEGLDDEERELLLEITERHLYDPDEIVVREGDKSRDVFVVKSGRVEVAKMDTVAQERRLAILEPGAVFGEISYVLGSPRSATVRAVEASELLCVDGGAAETLRESGKSVAYEFEHNLFEMLAERQADLNADLLQMMNGESEQQEQTQEDMRERLLEKWTF